MKNHKPPSFQFYPQDFLADLNVTLMNMEERGAYITLLCHNWIEGAIPGLKVYSIDVVSTRGV